MVSVYFYYLGTCSVYVIYKRIMELTVFISMREIKKKLTNVEPRIY